MVIGSSQAQEKLIGRRGEGFWTGSFTLPRLFAQDLPEDQAFRQKHFPRGHGRRAGVFSFGKKERIEMKFLLF